jgi:hypothetical protein
MGQAKRIAGPWERKEERKKKEKMKEIKRREK